MTFVYCKIRRRHLIDEQIKLSRLLDAPAPAQFYVVRGETAEAVLQREEALKQRLEPLIEKQIISGYQAMSNWVPSLRTQEAHRQLIRTAIIERQWCAGSPGCSGLAPTTHG